MDTERAAVVLVCMPFQMVTTSSLSIALLATCLRRRGVPAREAWLHFELASLMGVAAYQAIADGGTRRGLLGELLFAEQIFGEIRNENLRAELDGTFGRRPERDALLRELRTRCLEVLLPQDGSLLGFTTSFNQLMASLWLAREVKAREPGARVVLGGSSCAAPMGAALARLYPEVDHVVSGAGEQVLLALATGRRAECQARFIEGCEPDNLEALPIPDYDAFVGAATSAGAGAGRLLTFETSRGCWWGERHRCRFCGLNGAQIRFRTKGTQRVVDEIETLWRRYGRNLAATDAIISMRVLRGALPRLQALPSGPGLFFEVKSNLCQADVKALRGARVGAIQPGVESLCSELLGRLRKGVSALHNIALLKWCREQGVCVSWNLLYGIPGERAEHYHRQIALTEKLPHLDPPQGASRVRLDRFSDYFEAWRSYSWRAVRPLPEYAHIHQSADPAMLSQLAYHFEGAGGGLDLAAYEADLHNAVARWRARRERGDGLYWSRETGLFRVDDDRAEVFESEEGLEEVLAASHEIVSMRTLLLRSGASPRYIDALVDAGILVREGDKLVNLAVRLPE